MGKRNKNRHDLRCQACVKFLDEGWTIENAKDEENPACFPREYQDFITCEDNLVNGRGNQILQCPKCGLMFEYTVEYPGGSHDAMTTMIVERIAPVWRNGVHLRRNLPPPPPDPGEPLREFRCPACGSDRVDTVDAGCIGGEVFVELKCLECGNDGLLDQYQLMAWKKTDTD